MAPRRDAGNKEGRKKNNESTPAAVFFCLYSYRTSCSIPVHHLHRKTCPHTHPAHTGSVCRGSGSRPAALEVQHRVSDKTPGAAFCSHHLTGMSLVGEKRRRKETSFKPLSPRVLPSECKWNRGAEKFPAESSVRLSRFLERETFEISLHRECFSFPPPFQKCVTSSALNHICLKVCEVRL